jgi:hypothetical protein
VGGQGPRGLQYVPGGEFGGDLLYTSFTSSADGEIWRVVIDPSTGLPDGGANTPTEELFADGFTAPPLGLVFDPIHPDSLFLTTWDDGGPGNSIVEISGFAATFGSTTTTRRRRRRPPKSPPY